ncbi:MAG: hypothetical protein AAFQ59_16105 [Pseudomonadota bacterium]
MSHAAAKHSNMRSVHASPKVATEVSDPVLRMGYGQTMVLEYKIEVRLRDRLLLALAIPFVALIGAVLISFFGVFGRDAYDLIGSIIERDNTRLRDFLGYVVIVTLSVGGTCTLIFAALYTAFFHPNHIVEIDPDRRVVNVYFFHVLPWLHSPRASYRFDEIEAIELKYDDEQNRILLRLPDRKRPLILIYEFRRWTAERKFKQLKEMGLPTR